MHDVQWNILRDRFGFSRRGDVDREQLTSGHLHRRVERPSPRGYLTLDNQALQPFARQVRQQFGERLVQAKPMLRFANRCFDDGNPRTHWLSM